MAATEAQQFLNALDKKLWTAADKLRANLDAAVYKHAVLGLIFLKYVSDAFELRSAKSHNSTTELSHSLRESSLCAGTQTSCTTLTFGS